MHIRAYFKGEEFWEDTWQARQLATRTWTYDSWAGLLLSRRTGHTNHQAYQMSGTSDKIYSTPDTTVNRSYTRHIRDQKSYQTHSGNNTRHQTHRTSNIPDIMHTNIIYTSNQIHQTSHARHGRHETHESSTFQT
jgi:hypothetical protein